MHYHLYYIDINHAWYDLHDLHNVSIYPFLLGIYLCITEVIFIVNWLSPKTTTTIQPKQ